MSSTGPECTRPNYRSFVAPNSRCHLSMALLSNGQGFWTSGCHMPTGSLFHQLWRCPPAHQVDEEKSCSHISAGSHAVLWISRDIHSADGWNFGTYPHHMCPVVVIFHIEFIRISEACRICDSIIQTLIFEERFTEIDRGIIRISRDTSVRNWGSTRWGWARAA